MDSGSGKSGENYNRIEKDLFETLRIAHMGRWEFDPANNKVVLVGDFPKILGIESQSISTLRQVVPFIHPEDSSDFLRTIEKSVLNRKRWYFEHRVIRTDGHVRYVISRGKTYYKQNKPVRMVGTILDITKRKKAEIALSSEKDKTQMYLNTSAAFMIVIDKKKKVQIINQKGCEILGLREEEIVGKKWIANFVPHGERTMVRNVFDKLMNGEVESVEFFENAIITGSGGRKMMEWHNAVITDDHNKPVAMLSSGIDITRRKEAEKIRMDAIVEGEERERSRVAKELHDGLMQMLSAVSLNMKALEEEIASLKSAKRNSYENAIQLLDTAISETRNISHRMMPRELERFGLVNAVFNLCEKINENTPVDLEFSYEGPDGKWDQTIEIGLYRIMQELINNVVKHSQSTKALIKIVKKDNKIAVLVRDNGTGFDIEDDTSGIGLQNIATRVNSLNGTLNITSTKGTGTSVDIRVPYSN